MSAPEGVMVEAASTARVEDRELLRLVLRSAPDGRERGCWFVIVGPSVGGRLVAGGALDGPLGPLAEQARASERPLSAAAAGRRLARAARRTRDAGMPVERELAGTLALALETLPGVRGPISLRLLPDAGDRALRVGALDDRARLFALMDELLDAFERATPEDPTSPAWRSGDLVAGAMIEFKARYADGRLDHWTCADVSEFMLTWLPRVLVSDAELFDDVGSCVQAFLRFMASRGSLLGDPASDLAAAAAAAAAQLPARLASVTRRGPAADLWRAVARAPGADEPSPAGSPRARARARARLSRARA